MFAPRYFGVRHFAPRHFAPGTDQEPVVVEVVEGGVGPAKKQRISPEYARQADLAKQAFDKRNIEYSEQLSRIVEAAFNRELNKVGQSSPQKIKPVKTIRKRVTRRVYQSVTADDLRYKINEISKLVDAYAQILHAHWLDILRRQDEDAIILLLMEA